MSTMYGADVSQLRSLAAQFDRNADNLDRIRGTVGSVIQISAWHGPEAGRFRSQWAGDYSSRVAAASRMLRDGADRLRANADGQERASAVAGGSWSGLTPGGSGGAVGGAGLAAAGISLGWASRALDLAANISGGAEHYLQRFAPRWSAGAAAGQFRSPSGMSFLSKLRSAWSGSNFVAKPGQAANLGKWSTASKVLGGVGVAVSFASSAWNQWTQDANNSSLTTEAKVTRSATVGLTTAAAGWAAGAVGMKAGAALGAVVGGPVGAAVGAVVGGVVGGMIGSGVGEAIGNALKDQAGKAADAVGSWVSSWNPFK